MKTERIPPQVANDIWRILVEECGCRDDRHDHYSFVHYLSGAAGGFGHEYRFMGALGFGGKFYNDHYRWRVGCYPEHVSPKREAMIQRANDRLAELRLSMDIGDAS